MRTFNGSLIDKIIRHFSVKSFNPRWLKIQVNLLILTSWAARTKLQVHTKKKSSPCGVQVSSAPLVLVLSASWFFLPLP
jgi:hypothetical protein